ncbi:hypothetical protein JHW43_003198 [Diplocarpon mali]|nr:hypothetical protein JHW43_003198 [Diplocarpon mali]
MARSNHTRASEAGKTGLTKSKIASASSASDTPAAPASVAPTSDRNTTSYAIAGDDVIQGRVAVLEPGPLKIKQKSPFLKLPKEVKSEIYKLAVTLVDPVTPIQIAPRSNKFVWSRDQNPTINSNHSINISAVPMQAALSLSLVCKEMYESVSLGHLFYKNNVFDFSCLDDPVRSLNTYLVAITEARRQEITTMKVKFHGVGRDRVGTVSEAFALIASCKGLTHLTVKLHSNLVRYSTKFVRPFEMAKTAFRGLSLDFDFDMTNSWIPASELPELKEKWLEQAKITFADTLAMPRKGEYDHAWFRRAHESVDLDVHGEGRLSGDKKPCIVSSRTRTAVRKAQKLSDIGTVLAGDAHPKYDINGEFAHFLETITECRIDTSEDGTPTVMFRVRHRSTPDYHNITSPLKSSWEDVKVLASHADRTLICHFYASYPAKPGKEIVLAVWKEYVIIDDDQEVSAKWARSAKAGHEKKLGLIIKRQDAIENAAAAQRKKSARKAAAAVAAKLKENKAAASKAKKASGGVVKESAKKS